MSAQGGTIQRRGTVEMPIWPVAALVVAALAAAIGMTLLRDAGQTRFVTSVTDSERFANSTAAVREQGAVAPAIDLRNSGAAIRERGFAVPITAIDPVVLENSSAAVREQGALLPGAIWGVSHVTPIQPTYTGYAGLENPTAYATVAWGSIGGPNEALHRQYSPPQEGTAPKFQPTVVHEGPCMQCR
jgi:hypothetical protein